jgi:hypothetical protein
MPKCRFAGRRKGGAYLQKPMESEYNVERKGVANEEVVRQVADWMEG